MMSRRRCGAEVAQYVQWVEAAGCFLARRRATAFPAKLEGLAKTFDGRADQPRGRHR